ncbi:hypothetical protein DEQ92_20140 [Haloferax sp. Atlit-6N]|uniref:Uncharacterized protein n=1 Tax=Haloferax gibbonsii TaxID=35746 RepID=A0A871BL60_HALGI|nr:MULTISPECIES: hypothetical protein [Haloferax]QOS13484.1 uncharacterized protein HfgLR_21260 [Haloferax gibbonsii]REA00577.1 hypothetical protein DEQ92_20140 [Haloferax sp. Atlit-6N]
MTESIDSTRTTVEWRRISPTDITPPIVRRISYLELKLEHPALEPSGHSDRFFPDAIPYESEGTSRVFYWRPALAPSTTDPMDWELACATTHELVGFNSLPASGPPLVTEGASGTILVVDGTVAGDATTSHVSSYSTPDLSIDSRSDTVAELSVNGTSHSIPVGTRRRIRLSEQCIQPVGSDSGSTTVTPELVVRYPGRRELHHPARSGTYRLFPSFGLDLDGIPNPLPVPTTAGELDDRALATKLGVDLSKHAYPERVLWQAFAHTAFNLQTDMTPALTTLNTGHIVLRTRETR